MLHRSDRGHDKRGIFPAGTGVGGAAVRFAVDNPTGASGRRHRPGSRLCGQRRTRRRGTSSCSPVPMAARSSRPGAVPTGQPGVEVAGRTASHIGFVVRMCKPPEVGGRRRVFTFHSHCVIGDGLGEARIAADMRRHAICCTCSTRRADRNNLALPDGRPIRVRRTLMPMSARSPSGLVIRGSCEVRSNAVRPD
jgi:hypothetical protein